MSIEYVIDITSIDYYQQSSVIKNINWTLTGTKNGKEYIIDGIRELPSPDEDNFIPFDEVNIDVLRGWLLDLIPVEQYYELIEQELDKDVKIEPILVNILIEDLK